MLFSFIKSRLLWLLLFLAYGYLTSAFQSTDNIRLIVPQERKSICLTMIVKNESRIIERCLNAVKDSVDCISICDTGSTDNTIEIIEQFMTKNHIPGTVHQHVWKNFGHNRTLSAEAAQQTLKGLGFPLDNTYLLLLDADMILEVDPSFEKQALKDDSYLITQKNSRLAYENTRLMRASLPWKCVGVTHEYWNCKVPFNKEKLTALIINDHGDGGCKADKFERDIKLLTQGLEEEPDNVRYMFYLAQSYRAIKNYPEAIKWYLARIAKGGWKEEVWYSKYMLGETYHDLDNWNEALHWYLEAYNHNPERAESLYKVARHYREAGQHEIAYFFAKSASQIPYPKNQVLFISHPTYNYLIDEELSISAYYTAYKEDGFEAANRLVLKNGIPKNTKKLALQNLTFYAKPLKALYLLHLPVFQQDKKGVTAEKQPFTSYKLKRGKSHQEQAIKYDSKYDFQGYRVVSPPLPFDWGHLLLIEQEIDEKRGYLHRFFFLGDNDEIAKISKPFLIEKSLSECCSGMVIDQTQRTCVISFGVDGTSQHSQVCIELDTIRKMLEPLP